MMKSWLCSVQPGLFDADDAFHWATRRLKAENWERRDDISRLSTAPLNQWAFFTDPLAFLDLAKQTFEKALDGLEGEEPGIDGVRQELRAFVSSIPVLKQAVRDHVPSEEERQ